MNGGSDTYINYANTCVHEPNRDKEEKGKEDGGSMKTFKSLAITHTSTPAHTHAHTHTSEHIINITVTRNIVITNGFQARENEMSMHAVWTHICMCISFHIYLEARMVHSFERKKMRYGLHISERLHLHANINAVKGWWWMTQAPHSISQVISSRSSIKQFLLSPVGQPATAMKHNIVFISQRGEKLSTALF